MVNIQGDRNFVLNNTSDSTINITQLTGKSSDYHQLQEHLEELQEHFAIIPVEEIDKRLKYSQKIADQMQLTEAFEKDVRTLAATFERIDINTARLKTAKKHFDSGEFTQARTLLETESNAMADDQAKLLTAKEQKTDELARIQEQLKDNATEYLIYAQTLELDYSNLKRFDLTQGAYRKSINAFGFIENIFAYAVFLYHHNQFSEAEPLLQRLTTEFKESLSPDQRAMTLNNLANLHSNTNELSRAEEEYTEALEIYRKLAQENPRAYLPDVAMTLNNLATLHSNTNELSRAEEEYTEALTIRRKLAQENPRAYLPNVAMTLNNLANLHSNTNELSRAEEEYTEALEIYRKLAQENPRPYLPNVAMTLNNLANLHSNTNELSRAEEEYTEALTIRRKLAQENPRAYLPNVAMTLNNLVILHSNTNELSRAEEEYTEALELYRKLAQENPRAYLPNVAMTLINFSIYYIDSSKNKGRSVYMVKEGIRILQDFRGQASYVKEYMETAQKILNYWGEE